MKPITLVISCEHGGNNIPFEYQYLFASQQAVLNTHRGIDFGALEIAEKLSQNFSCDYVNTTVSRLLIDCNRSLKHRACFSEFTANLSSADRQKIIEQYYQPYRQKIENIINTHISKGKQVLHLSIHSFTPELKGTIRNAAIGLLYDSKRHGEREVARIWHELLLKQSPAYRVRLNYPYQGKSDGFTSALRKQHSEQDYLGLEVENNQVLVQDEYSFKSLCHMLTYSLQELLQIL